MLTLLTVQLFILLNEIIICLREGEETNATSIKSIGSKDKKEKLKTMPFYKIKEELNSNSLSLDVIVSDFPLCI